MHKPRLIPVSVPWAISSVPQFRISESPEGRIASIAFTAFFFLKDIRADSACETVVIASEPPPFSRALSDQGAIYRRVRVAFQGTVFSERMITMNFLSANTIGLHYPFTNTTPDRSASIARSPNATGPKPVWHPIPECMK